MTARVCPGPAVFLAIIALAMMSPGSAGAAQWDEAPLSGRLFFTDEERRALDRLRRQSREREMPAPAESPAESLAINGVVMRANGNNTVWINGEPVSEEDVSWGKVRIVKRPGDTVGVEVSRGRDHVHLKPGQRAVGRGTWPLP